jgi:aspartate/methionine/tyrosine aminotransferase
MLSTDRFGGNAVKFPIFELERVQSLYENTVDYNLTESGFHPFTLGELLTPDQLAELHDTVLGYGQTNGSVALRERIAALYPGLGADNVLVTNGSSEANFVVCHTLLEPGDEVVMMVPNYMQIWGIAEEMGATPRAFHLREENGWAPDLDELRLLVGDRTRLITVCNPNNPTGHTLGADDMREIVAIAESVGAWVHADEVYRGAELDGEESASFVGLGDRVIATGGLSKAYALPGLRVGWLAGPAETVATAWAYRDYTSITAGILSHAIAEIVLAPDLRPKTLARNRSLLADNLELTLDWVAGHGELLRFIPPKAGGMAFMHYDLDINSSELSDWLRTEYSVFILAGDCYGMDHYFRIGIGTEASALRAGLERVSGALKARFGV